MEIIWITNITIISIDLIIFSIIAYNFIKRYRETGAKLFAQFFGFSMIFALENALTIYIYYDFSKFLGKDVSLPLLGINLIGLIAILMLYKYLSQ
ncbi:hypothetical protein [Picrophilus oshimae]|uniref:Membrane spanning protein n=1 Tax=Picrophilus torridus (strain ATCC 700027 / DSM 9790 / JCM 10055 / NBRC 100828 / KAW 2/3) TaxID=1122961 RepID=Q6KZ10_PICTO|nr:hypothetical protein [Picrophilus oshimae]AAT44042.1 membrane spanning protein [Picrophilus oshimae DSM 9789]SMD30887.1 hypothetical protein SAMN02745355_0804 [Picrophilus oshimae DSM 9789]